MMMSFLSKVKKLAWFLPGFLLWASFPPIAEKTDVLFALAPLMWLARQGEAHKSAKRWFQSGIFFWVATLSWMPAIVKNGGPLPLVALGWFALAAYCALYFAAYGYLSATFWRWANARGVVAYRLIGILLVEPILWCGFELLRSRLFGGFAWNQLGVVAVNGGFGAPAAIGGVYLCSAAIILINGSIAGIVERLVAAVKRSPLPRSRSLETILAFVVVWGVYQLPSARSLIDSAPDMLKVALLQRNFPCVFEAKTENPYIAYSNLMEHVDFFEPELVVLPESAMCEFGPVDSPRAVDFAERLSGCRFSVLAGGTRYGDGEIFNSAALYDGADLQFYDKVHLVPFGEFIPGDKLFPWLQRFAPVGSCTPGKGELLKLPRKGIPFGVGICYEDTDSALMRRYAAKGARFLCFITNDSWFSHSEEAVAHSWQAVARSVETGLPVVRVGNSGVSGTIVPNGKASWLLGYDGRPQVDRRGVMFDRVPIPPSDAEPTPYVRYGDLPLAIVFTITIILLLALRVRTSERRECVG